MLFGLSLSSWLDLASCCEMTERVEHCLGDGEGAVDMENVQMDAWALARTECARYARRRNNKGQQKNINTAA